MNELITALDIADYRCIHGLTLSNLGRINVLAGVNNSGKTTILEAVGLLSNPLDRGNFQKWALMRTESAENRNKKVADDISFLFQNHQTIQLSAEIRGERASAAFSAESYTKNTSSGKSYKVIAVTARLNKEDSGGKARFCFQNDGRSTTKGIAGIFHTENISVHSSFYQNCIRYISQSMLTQKKNLLLDVIRSFDGDILDVMLNNDDILLESKTIGVQPLFNFGSGMQKAVLLASTLLSAENNVLLIDEIDSNINISAFRSVFLWFIQKCRELNIQTFITTHSLEAIDAILEAGASIDGDDIRIITLRKSQKSHRILALVRTGAEARNDRGRYEMEMRV